MQTRQHGLTTRHIQELAKVLRLSEITTDLRVANLRESDRLRLQNRLDSYMLEPSDTKREGLLDFMGFRRA